MTTQTNQQPANQQTRTVTPTADIFETDDHYRIELDLPGVDEQDIDVAIERNVLTVSAHSVSNTPEDMKESWREYHPSHYQRRFTLGRGIDRENVSATYRHGVLALDLPKATEAKPQRIAVSIN